MNSSLQRITTTVTDLPKTIRTTGTRIEQTCRNHHVITAWILGKPCNALCTITAFTVTLTWTVTRLTWIAARIGWRVFKQPTVSTSLGTAREEIQSTRTSRRTPTEPTPVTNPTNPPDPHNTQTQHQNQTQNTQRNSQH